MTFITYLHKDKWIIRVNGHEGRYLLEYTNDNWETKQLKYYESKKDLLKALSLRFSEEELKLIRKFESDPE